MKMVKEEKKETKEKWIMNFSEFDLENEMHTNEIMNFFLNQMHELEQTGLEAKLNLPKRKSLLIKHKYNFKSKIKLEDLLDIEKTIESVKNNKDSLT